MSEKTRNSRRLRALYSTIAAFGACAFYLGLLVEDRFAGSEDHHLVLRLFVIACATLLFGTGALFGVRKLGGG